MNKKRLEATTNILRGAMRDYLNNLGKTDRQYCLLLSGTNKCRVIDQLQSLLDDLREDCLADHLFISDDVNGFVHYHNLGNESEFPLPNTDDNIVS